MIISKLANFNWFCNLFSTLEYYLSKSAKKSFFKFDSLFHKYSPSKETTLTQKEIRKIYRDYLKGKLKYGVTDTDYLAFDWMNLSERAKANFITVRINSELYHKYDNLSLCPIMADKVRFNQVYKSFCKRDWLWVHSEKQYDDFLNFCNKYKKIVLKPKDGQQGKGVMLVEVITGEQITNAWNKCLSNKYLVEEVLCQSNEMALFHPSSINTIRISTAVDKKGEPHVVAASMRCGRGGSFVDNASSGGLFCGIDVSTGMIISPGIDMCNNKFLIHPDSNVVFLGRFIPQWEELHSLALQAASLIPKLRYIGWDWVLCKDGHWELLEGNEPGGANVTQQGVGHGLLNEYYKYLK